MVEAAREGMLSFSGTKTPRPPNRARERILSPLWKKNHAAGGYHAIWGEEHMEAIGVGKTAKADARSTPLSCKDRQVPYTSSKIVHEKATRPVNNIVRFSMYTHELHIRVANNKTRHAKPLLSDGAWNPQPSRRPGLPGTLLETWFSPNQPLLYQPFRGVQVAGWLGNVHWQV